MKHLKPPPLRAYLSIMKMRFAVQLQYRAAAAAGFFTQLFFGFVKISVLMAFFSSSTQPQPMSIAQTVTYLWLVQVTFRMLPWIADREMMNMVRSGGIAYELCRPLNLYVSWYSRMLAIRLVPTMLSGIPIFIIALMLPGRYAMSPPASPAAALAFIIALAGSLLLGCAMTNIITISSLWTGIGDGADLFFSASTMLLSGLTVPLPFFPEWSQPILRLLPFSSLADLPFRFYSGVTPASQLLPLMALQLAWILAFVMAGLWLLRLATRRVVIQGG